MASICMYDVRLLDIVGVGGVHISLYPPTHPGGHAFDVIDRFILTTSIVMVVPVSKVETPASGLPSVS